MEKVLMLSLSSDDSLLAACVAKHIHFFAVSALLHKVPLYVATKMASIKRSSLVPLADGYARAAQRSIGYEPRSTPYWPHSLVWAIFNSLLEWAIDTWRFKYCLAIRNKGQLKDARKKE